MKESIKLNDLVSKVQPGQSYSQMIRHDSNPITLGQNAPHPNQQEPEPSDEY
jgi:hypothetical protein